MTSILQKIRALRASTLPTALIGNRICVSGFAHRSSRHPGTALISGRMSPERISS